ncbi:MAG: tryptophan--tRNA ligase [Saprospiraceae bacterium]|nr:tryptophan--tRNA ligase [Saprospiraceae bacterium]
MSTGQRVLSCIQPTGNLHLGRYFGAIQNWERLQGKYQCLYGIVNYHAMTMPYDRKKLTTATWELAFNLAASGLSVDNIFVQSLIPEHAELAWIFNCITGFGELGRMTQFKDKSQRVREFGKDAMISSGLYTYPVLQAADILIYRADFVPVGKDQEQHLELTRNVAQRFNHHVDEDYFTLPSPLFTEIPKVMSTADPSKKMSASLGEKHNIDVFANPQQIRKQIRSAVTDTGSESGEMSPGVENLFSLLKATGRHDLYAEFFEQYQKGQRKYGALKDAVADVITGLTTPLRERKAEIVSDKKIFKEQIRASTGKIRKQAQQTVNEVKERMGLLNLRHDNL